MKGRKFIFLHGPRAVMAENRPCASSRRRAAPIGYKPWINFLGNDFCRPFKFFDQATILAPPPQIMISFSIFKPVIRVKILSARRWIPDDAPKGSI